MKKLHLVSMLVLAVFIATFSVIDLVLVVATSSPAEAAELSFCQNNSTGVLKFAPKSLICPKNNTLIQIDSNVVGQPGPKGDKGDTGATGPQGPPGVANGISRAAHGVVAWDGVVEAGTGFYVNSINCYDYVCVTNIVFTPQFNTTPTCTVSVDETSIDTPIVIKTALADSTGAIFAYEKPNSTPVRTGFYFICVE